MTPIKCVLSYAATGTAQTNTVYIQENGFVQNMIIDASDLGGAKTVTVVIKDIDGDTVFSSGAKSGGASYTYGGIGSAETGSVPIDSNYTVVGTLSEAWGGTGGAVTIKLYAKNLGDGRGR